MPVTDDIDIIDARRQAHKAFSRMLNAMMTYRDIPSFRVRGQGYIWLAQQFGVKRHACRIKNFTYEQCLTTVVLCNAQVQLLQDEGKR